MKSIVNGEEVTLSQEEEAEILAEWAANEAQAQADEIEQAKQAQKDELMKLKLESMLIVEFAEIDAATNKADIEKVKLK